MAIIGIQLDRNNPEFIKSDFLFWMPQYTNYLNTSEGDTTFNKLKTIVNNKIFKSIFGTDWELAMSYGIAHYLTLIARNQQAPSGSSLAEIAGDGVSHGLLTNASVGSFSKSYDTSKTILSENEAMFWNQTSYGSALMVLLKTKPIPSIMVVTSNPVEGAN